MGCHLHGWVPKACDICLISRVVSTSFDGFTMLEMCLGQGTANSLQPTVSKKFRLWVQQSSRNEVLPTLTLLQMQTGSRVLVVVNKELRGLHKHRPAKKWSKQDLLSPRYGSMPFLTRERPPSAERVQVLLGPIIPLHCPHEGWNHNANLA